MTELSFGDAILIELTRRLVEQDMNKLHQQAYIQMCECSAEPDVDEWKCSACGQPYKPLFNE